MVKRSLTGKVQTTTCKFGMTHQKWVGRANCGIMLIVDGVLTACTVDRQGNYLMNADTGEFIDVAGVRVYRSTIRQIRNIVGI